MPGCGLSLINPIASFTILCPRDPDNHTGSTELSMPITISFSFCSCIVSFASLSSSFIMPNASLTVRTLPRALSYSYMNMSRSPQTRSGEVFLMYVRSSQVNISALNGSFTVAIIVLSLMIQAWQYFLPFLLCCQT